MSMSRLTLSVTVLALALLLAPGPASAEEVNVKVNGMVCGFCAQGIKSKLMEQEGVEAVDVDLETKVVTVSLDTGAAVDNETIRTLIADSGYDTVSIDRSPASPEEPEE